MGNWESISIISRCWYRFQDNPSAGWRMSDLEIRSLSLSNSNQTLNRPRVYALIGWTLLIMVILYGKETMTGYGNDFIFLTCNPTYSRMSIKRHVCITKHHLNPVSHVEISSAAPPQMDVSHLRMAGSSSQKMANAKNDLWSDEAEYKKLLKEYFDVEL